MNNQTYVLLVSADAEWRVVADEFRPTHLERTPLGETFAADVLVQGQTIPVRFFHGGWGKIAAAASAQFVIDTYKPVLMLNIGTCGGFDDTTRGDVVLANKTIVYDIIEQMGDPAEAIQAFTTDLPTDWLGQDLPEHTTRNVLLSADRDIVQTDIAILRKMYGASAADWESGAIAWTAQRNNTPVIILRGVSDTVSEAEAHAYGNTEHFEQGTRIVMQKLLADLPFYIQRWQETR